MCIRIDELLSLTPPRIFQRGRDYYDNDMVYELKRHGNTYRAKVEGQCEDYYDVELELSSDGEVICWECDCPYDMGDICKHVVAVMLAVRDDPCPETEAEEDARSIRELAAAADREKLEQLICDWARQDERFCLEVMSVLGTSVSRERRLWEKRVRSVIRESSRWDELDQEGCEQVCDEIDEALDRAESWAESGKASEAVEFICWLLETGFQAMTEAEEADTLTKLQDVLETCLKLTAEGERQDCFSVLMELLQSRLLDGWEEIRYELVPFAALVADGDDVPKLYHLLEQWAEKAEQEGRTGTMDRNKAALYRVIRELETPEKAERYLNEHLEVDELRDLALGQAMVVRDYQRAEQLCLEKSLSEHNGVSHWDRCLYEIYRLWRKRDRQLIQAKRLYLKGETSYYEIIKRLLTEDGRWEEEYPELREQAAAALPTWSYAALLSGEQDTERLMQLVRKYPELVRSYEKQLLPFYRHEICELYAEQIRRQAEQENNRRGYMRICQQAEQLAGLDPEAASALLAELEAAYPRRRAFLDEIRKLRAGQS